MFSELSGITAETGLDFSDEHTSLFGSRCGFGVTVTDTGDRYVVKIFCERPFERESEIFPLVSSLGEGLPKNTVMSQECEVGYVGISLEKYNLVQENIVYLTEFLDKLTAELNELGLAGSPWSFPREKRAARPDPPVKGGVKVRLGFDLRSVLGFFGAALGAAAMTVIAVLTVNANAEITAFGLAFEISAYILSGITAVVVFADYRFLARKLDACGVITCPVLTVLAVILSGLGTGVKACASYAGISFGQALGDYASLLAEYPDADKFVTGYITRGTVLAVLAAIGICIFYFGRHPDETELSEKIISDGDDDRKKH